MSKPLLTLAIVVSLGTVGCAGLGIQQGPSLSARIAQDQGVEPLWEHEAKQSPSVELPLYAEQHLERLWDTEPSKRTGESAGDAQTRDFSFAEELAAPNAVRF